MSADIGPRPSIAVSVDEDSPSLLLLKRRVEEQTPDFPLININAPDFSYSEYNKKVQDLFLGLDAPLEDISLTWDDLHCTVPVESPDLAIQTVISGVSGLASAIKHGGANLIRKDHPSKQKTQTAHVLNGVSGVVNPGEMCLVLGPSGSGASLLLSRIAGRQTGQLIQNSGKVLYNGHEKLGGVIEPPHYVQFVGQHDDHIAAITVRETLEFAAKCKWPIWMPHVDTIRKNDVVLTARMLGIERILDTIVGNDILRGVSGGEKKRVTIAEMLIGINAGAVVMDNWSKGLDAKTTLSICKSMKEFAVSQGSPVITSMQAPGTDAFKEYDTVCVLDQGQMLYFGPRDKAEDWFKSLGFYRPPQRSVPDFIATVANPALRAEYLPSDRDISHLHQPPPSTPEEFATRFAKSLLYAELKDKIADVHKQHNQDRVKIPKALWETAKKSNLQKTRYQIKAIGRRQIQFLVATRNAVIQDIMQNLIFGLILGSIFWQLPNSNGGASSRAGIIFLAFLFISLGALAKIGDKHEQKKVFAKQRYANFYNAWPYIFTMFLFDFVIELIRTICFLVPLYLMSGLNLGSSAQRLLYAILVVTMLSLIMAALTRFLVAINEDPNVAEGMGGTLTILIILYAGFMKRPDEIDDWLIWIYWANPLSKVYEALALNEYDGLMFRCRPEELIPNVDAIPLDFRICPVSTGEDYLRQNLGITITPIYRLYYFLALLGYLALLVSLSAVATALAKPSGHALKLTTEADEEERHRSITSQDVTSTIIDIQSRHERRSDTNFTFKNVKYSVNDGKKALLAGIDGLAMSGKVVLLMGESGAGKSTLLDVCALRKTMGKGTSKEGDIRINGVPITNELISYFTGYCEQNDLHVGETTVLEAVKFAANLRLPVSVSNREKNVRAMETLELLGLTPFSNILVKALGAGELKLLTMALEVVAEPMVLFLDEPTSGISASSALIVANALRRIADTGSCVVCTVHQPSKEVFSMFDRLLLLKRGGKQVYYGDIGEDGILLRRYFEARGASPMDEDKNTADWMLDVISDESVDWVEEWHNSQEKIDLGQEISEALESNSHDGKETQELYKRPGLGRQLILVSKRLFLRYWRLPEYNFTRVVLNMAVAVIVGLLFLRDANNTQTGATITFAALFLAVVPSSLGSQNVVMPTVQGRTVFYREIASGTYKPLAFHTALGLVEIPFTAFATTVFTVIFYFMVGLTTSRFGYFFLATQLLYFFAVMLGVFLSSVFAQDYFAAMIASSLTSIFSVLSGFFIRKDEMPVWWRWSTWINPFFYYLSGLVQNQMTDQVFTCTDSELLPIQLPPGFPSCEAIPGGDFNFVTVEEGKCAFCPIPTGETLIDAFSADDVNKWVALGALVAFIIVCRIGAGFGFAKLRFITR